MQRDLKPLHKLPKQIFLGLCAASGQLTSRVRQILFRLLCITALRRLVAAFSKLLRRLTGTLASRRCLQSPHLSSELTNLALKLLLLLTKLLRGILASSARLLLRLRQLFAQLRQFAPHRRQLLLGRAQLAHQLLGPQLASLAEIVDQLLQSVGDVRLALQRLADAIAAEVLSDLLHQAFDPQLFGEFRRVAQSFGGRRIAIFQFAGQPRDRLLDPLITPRQRAFAVRRLIQSRPLLPAQFAQLQRQRFDPHRLTGRLLMCELIHPQLLEIANQLTEVGRAGHFAEHLL